MKIFTLTHDSRSEREKAAEARIAAAQDRHEGPDPVDLAIVAEETAAYEAAAIAAAPWPMVLAREGGAQRVSSRGSLAAQATRNLQVQEGWTPLKVKLVYFKAWNGPDDLGGKYYSEGSYTSDHTMYHEVLDEVEKLRDDGKLPGLTAGPSDYHVLISVEPEVCPHLLVHPSLAKKPSEGGKKIPIHPSSKGVAQKVEARKRPDLPDENAQAILMFEAQKTGDANPLRLAQRFMNMLIAGGTRDQDEYTQGLRLREVQATWPPIPDDVTLGRMMSEAMRDHNGTFISLAREFTGRVFGPVSPELSAPKGHHAGAASDETDRLRAALIAAHGDMDRLHEQARELRAQLAAATSSRPIGAPSFLPERIDAACAAIGEMLANYGKPACLWTPKDATDSVRELASAIVDAIRGGVVRPPEVPSQTAGDAGHQSIRSPEVPIQMIQIGDVKIPDVGYPIPE